MGKKKAPRKKKRASSTQSLAHALGACALKEARGGTVSRDATLGLLRGSENMFASPKGKGSRFSAVGLGGKTKRKKKGSKGDTEQKVVDEGSLEQDLGSVSIELDDGGVRVAVELVRGNGVLDALG